MPTLSSYLKIQAAGIMSLLVVAYAISDFLLLPIHFEHAQAQKKLSELSLRTVNLTKNLSELQKCQREYEDLRNKLAQSYDSLDSESLDPLEWLHNVSERSGVQVKSFQDHRHDIVNSLPAVEIKLKASGTYQQVCDLLHQMERSSRPCFIHHLKISPKLDQAGALEIDASILVFPISDQFQKTLNDSSELSLSLTTNRSDLKGPIP